MARIGILTLQALGQTDIFYQEDVTDGMPEPGLYESLIPEPGESSLPWVNGDVPKTTPVCVEGDTSVILGWFKGEAPQGPMLIKIYVEYELADELLNTEEDPRANKQRNESEQSNDS